jgi:hypothetical protein
MSEKEQAAKCLLNIEEQVEREQIEQHESGSDLFGGV